MMRRQVFRIDGLTVEEHLFRMQDETLKPFSRHLHPGVENVLGVRVPQLRKLAARIAHSDWQHYLSSPGTYYMEERMLHGMVLGAIPPDDDVERYLGRVSRFVKEINSWSVCDTFKFAGGKKYVMAHRERFWEFLNTWMHSDKEYEVRFGVVLSMQLFIDCEHLPALLHAYAAIGHEGYYVRMAVAWALSVCYVKYPDVTLAFLQHCRLDVFTLRKTVSKILDSYRVSAERKEQIKKLRETPAGQDSV